MAQRGQGLSNCGGMMSEIIDHFYTADFAAHFLPTGNSRKTLQRIADLVLGHTVKSRRRRGHGSVADVEFSDQRDLENVIAKLKARTLGRIGDVANSLRTIFREADLDHLSKAIPRDFHAVVIVAIQQDHAV